MTRRTVTHEKKEKNKTKEDQERNAPQVKRSSAGLGLFATRSYTKGEYIIDYTGELISTEEADRRGGKYLFILNEKLVIDGKGRENQARYINHSCLPNAYAETDEDETRIRVYAKKAIKPGDEITYHYGKTYWKEYIEPVGCKCAKCSTLSRTRKEQR